jgi:hypothetical protein
MASPSQTLPHAGKRHGRAALLCVVAGLAAFVFVLNPWFVKINAKARAHLAQEIARENETFCVKRGFAIKSPEHAACAADLNELRARHDKRTQESVFGMI